MNGGKTLGSIPSADTKLLDFSSAAECFRDMEEVEVSESSSPTIMASCWNGIQGGLKNRCSKGRVGSSPTEATLIIF